MAEHTEINWTDATWSPWWGCQKVSPGCHRCYAESLSKRYGHGIWGPEAPRRFLSEDHWRKPLVWDRKAREAGRIMRVFPSMCDPLEDHSDLNEARARFFATVQITPNLMWLILTKRPENWWKFPAHWLNPGGWPKNAIFGVTGENDEWFTKRARLLAAQLPATIPLFLSAEPLLGLLNAERLLPMFSWVICGGESGHGARPMHPDWARSLRDQCAAAGVPFLFKQWGEWAPIDKLEDPHYTRALKGQLECTVVPADPPGIPGTPVYRVGKKAAGRLLDGVERNGLPLYWPPNVGMGQQPNPLEVLV